MKAMIFSAGFGKRLLPITATIPKALVTIKGRPALDWIITFLIQSSISEIFINTHYFADQVESFIKNKKYEIPVTIIYEEKILGTGGGLYNTRKRWGKSDIYICNVDILCDFDLKEFFKYHLFNKGKITLAVNDIQSSSMLIVDEQQNLCGWYKKGSQLFYREPQGNVTRKGFCGMHLFNASLFDQMKTPPFESIIDQYMEWIRTGVLVKTWSIGDRYWIDMGTPATLKQAEQTFKGYGTYLPS